MAAFGTPEWRGLLPARSAVKVDRRIYAEIEKRATKPSAAPSLATEVLRFAHVAIALPAGSMKVGLQDDKNKMNQEFWALFNRKLSAWFPKENERRRSCRDCEGDRQCVAQRGEIKSPS